MIKANIDGQTYTDITSVKVTAGTTVKTVQLSEVSSGGDTAEYYTASRTCATAQDVWDMLSADGISDDTDAIKVLSLYKSDVSNATKPVDYYIASMVISRQNGYRRLFMAAYRNSGCKSVDMLDTGTGPSNATNSAVITAGDKYTVCRIY